MSGVDNLGYDVELQENGLCDNDGKKHGLSPLSEHQIYESTERNSNSNIQQPPVQVSSL